MTTPNIDSIDTAAVVNGGDTVLSLKIMNESKKEEHGQQPVQFLDTPTTTTDDKYECTPATEKDFEMDMTTMTMNMTTMTMTKINDNDNDQ
jgi:hypothetical protein